MFEASGCPISAFHKSMVNTQDYMDVPETIVPLPYLYRSWYAFRRLLNIDEEKFICPECGKFPQTLIMDGTALGMRKDLLPYVRETTTETRELVGTSIKDRTTSLNKVPEIC